MGSQQKDRTSVVSPSIEDVVDDIRQQGTAPEEVAVCAGIMKAVSDLANQHNMDMIILGITANGDIMVGQAVMPDTNPVTEIIQDAISCTVSCLKSRTDALDLILEKVDAAGNS